MTPRLAKLALGLALCISLVGVALLWSLPSSQDAARAAEVPPVSGTIEQQQLEW